MTKEQDNWEKGHLKLFVFKTFPYEELKKVCDAIIALGYDCKVVDNGNFVFTKKGTELKAKHSRLPSGQSPKEEK